MQRRLLGRSALLLAAVSLITIPAPMASAAPTTAAECVAAGKVWVHVEAGATVKGGCAAAFSSGREALTSAGFTLTDRGGFLTHIDGIPVAPGPQDWWSYWQLNPNVDGTYTQWDFSQLGMDSQTPYAGSVEGWALHNSYAVVAPPPKVNPLAGYTAPPKDPVVGEIAIPDAKLRACVNTKLAQPPTSVVTQKQAASVTDLRCSYAGITDLTGIEHFDNLTSLDLTMNKVSDVSGLADLSKLNELVLDGNLVTDAAPLAKLTGLTH